MSLADVLLLIVLIALNGIFVGVEFAAIASRRSRLDLMIGDTAAARIVHTWLEQPAARDRLIASSQLGITLVSLALGAVGENAFEVWLTPMFESFQLPPELSFVKHVYAALPLILSLSVVTGLHVVFGEQVPKVAVLHNPERFALASARFMQTFGTVFKWFIDILDWATRQTLKLIGISDTGSHASFFSAEEFKQMVNGPETEGMIEQPEREMLSAVMDFGDMVVRQVYVPRLEIIAIQADTPIWEIIRIASDNNITKLPVYEDSLEQIIGIVHVLDLLRALRDDRDNHRLIARELVREALFVPETVSVNHLLHQFRSRRTHMAIVLDEFGGMAGLVTLEDLLDEIIGEVQDSFSAEPPDIQSQPDGSTLVEGNTLIDNFNDYFNLTLADPYYDTMAGYILGKLGRIPQAGDTFDDTEHKLRFKVEKMDRLRIAKLRLTPLND